MARKIVIGEQDFEKLVSNNYFYVDKTSFIKEWWERGNRATLITRPRRFGKTLNMSMLNCFFSDKYAGRGDLFEGLDIWKESAYRKLQGTYPVISVSFASIKKKDYQQAKEWLYQVIVNLYSDYQFLLESGALTDNEKDYFKSVHLTMSESVAAMSLHQLSRFLYNYYKKKVIILLDEYDTPMQEAYLHGYWENFVDLTRSMFDAAFKTNPYLERAVLTGVTQVSKESVFSGLNNLDVVTTTSDEYAAAFGFTEAEVFAAMDEAGLDAKEEVKKWYDGFVFGRTGSIYNPWSVINFLYKKEWNTYWANTSSQELVSRMIRTGGPDIKKQFEILLQGGAITCRLNEQIVYNQLEDTEGAVWSLLLASGYLKAVQADIKNGVYQLALTNYEVEQMFQNMISGWFSAEQNNYNGFIRALLSGDMENMNAYMNDVAMRVFSYFDTGKGSSGGSPERFYHGFVLGLIVELRDRYVIASNRESGYGRYDVLLEPLRREDDGIILEFKVHQPKDGSLNGTVQAALAQIEEKGYEQALLSKGIPKERIRKYGFAFEGKNVLIG